MNTPTTPPTPDTPEHPGHRGHHLPAAVARHPGRRQPGRRGVRRRRPHRGPADDHRPSGDRGGHARGDRRTDGDHDRHRTGPGSQHPAPPTPPEPQYLSGPAPFALVLGLLGLLVAGSVLVNELTDVTLPWGDLGPWSVVAAGLVVLLVGAIGLRSSRNRG